MSIARLGTCFIGGLPISYDLLDAHGKDAHGKFQKCGPNLSNGLLRFLSAFRPNR
jgi:hypothetical protein